MNVAALRLADGVTQPDVQSDTHAVAAPVPQPLPGFEGLGPHAGAVLSAIAVLGPDALLSHTAHVAELSVPDTLTAIDLLISARLLANSMPLRFVDEDTAERVLAALTIPRTIALRLRVAVQLRAIPGAAERVADQLIRIGPVGLGWAPEAYGMAAAQAMDDGDWERAANYLRHALADHLPAEQRMRLSRQLATLLADRDPRAAVTCLLQELRLRDTQIMVVETTRLLRRLATRLPNTPDVYRMFDEAADHLHGQDPAQAVRLQLTRTSYAMYRPEGSLLLSKLEGWLAASDLSDPSAKRALDATRACLAALREPRGGNAVELATSVLETAHLRQEWDTCWMAVSALLVTGDDDVTEEAWRKLDASLPAAGAEIQRAGCDLLRGYLHRRRGNLRGVVTALGRVLEACRAFGLSSTHSVVATAVANVAEALVQMGEPERARKLLADHSLLGDISHTGFSMCLMRGRGAVLATTGDLEAALADQLDCGRIVVAWAELNADFQPWRIEVVRTLLRLDRHADAVALAEADQEAARKWGSPRALGFAAHTLALTSSGARRAELLEEAAEQFAECGALLAEAQARHELAAALRDVGDEAGATCQATRARELANRCGAALDGERPTCAADSLTAKERRIVRLVVQGRTNGEIAEELEVARRTVEFHLSGVYRKLGISGRRELADCTGDNNLG